MALYPALRYRILCTVKQNQESTVFVTLLLINSVKYS